ncbi:MAG: sn-glycerol-3-phosphate ABC transporter ATP-binding protein UgpC [Anaerolineae bacterium]|nr:sn-glycerol-3-phosphate ABC transporter ATP-binding protein UgpC [Anaerolineae bacterium]MDK1080908.1 sn-glycerol-3-phosphate ABC transporter ATP-binding protein UgpC [Anaerolineae bacterium]MDK1118630.1 sn-glycerol-3-phosphate ABC transporter ATP-binding protein UgpC [Anaerolineae bacterium]
MASVTFNNVSKHFNEVVAVDGLNIDVVDKEFLVIVGPSGSGKSTALRLLAGLEEITGGEIKIDDIVVNDMAPKDRDIAMVFQSYALYPHLSVFDNMAFGLKIRKINRVKIMRRVNEAAEILGIQNLLHRRPRQLSGGERQRVAVGRAIVREPKVFLFDEPLSNLDAKLRVAVRAEINKLHQSLNTTFIYVTHDQVEAMTMATRIAVMNNGVLQQLDAPQELYDNPVNHFVAGFIGSPAMNFYPSKIRKDKGKLNIVSDSFTLPIPSQWAKPYESYEGKNVIFGIRPENIHDPDFMPANIHTETIEAKVDVKELMGNEIVIHLIAGDNHFVARIDPRSKMDVGQKVKLALDMDNFQIFNPETEETIH